MGVLVPFQPFINLQGDEPMKTNPIRIDQAKTVSALFDLNQLNKYLTELILIVRRMGAGGLKFRRGPGARPS
jgi:hypothetical protein